MPESGRPPVWPPGQPATPRVGAAGLALAVLLVGSCTRTPPPLASQAPLELGDRLFEERRYVESAEAYSAWLASHGAEAGADHALFRLALIHLSASSEVHDPGAARHLLERLVRDHPESPYRPAVEAILAWRNDLDHVRGQLEELKRIDLHEAPGDPPPSR